MESKKSKKGSVPVASIPSLSDDPWNALTHAKDMAVIDLQKLHLDNDDGEDCEITRALHMMQESEGSTEHDAHK